MSDTEAVSDGLRPVVAQDSRLARALLWSAFSLCLLAVVAALPLLALGASESTPADDFGLGGFGGLAFLVAALTFAAVGTVVGARVAENPIGWIFLA